MKKYITFAMLVMALIACNKEWTETQANTEEFEKKALADLREKRDNAKWEAESERTEENKKALEAYWAMLREYKQKAWLNTGEVGGQVPMVYYWFDGPTWQAAKGIARGWLQSIPDSVTAISIWGGLGGLHPKDLGVNRKKDAEIFQKKGGAILMCWQTPSVGIALPGSPDGKVRGYDYFRQKYPFAETRTQWAEIYARELSRYIIALGFDGYDVDWETCGDHGATSEEGTPLMMNYDDPDSNIAKFVREMAKYFGPVGPAHLVQSQTEREANIKALFNASTAGFHANEKEFIDSFTPYLPENYLTKRYYFCADVPCGVAEVFKNHFQKYFDKHFLQDYQADGVGGHIEQLGGKYYNSTSANYQAGNFKVMIKKGIAVQKRQVWGLGAYHGQSDFPVTNESDANFKKYLQDNNLKRKYLHYAWTREAIRIADPRPDYSGYVEKEPYIITP
ncbi:MAG: hypothetical protein Q4C98_04055 [Capnocytophaga sp.]|nr:hypothetical protein [Capnocytophaga sp.]